MIATDEQNLKLADTVQSVDSINAFFYGRFQYPWKPAAFDCATDPQFETVMLNQSIGSWDHSAVPRQPKIWVAGCGTNQAVFTALRYPDATIIGSDLSITSLATAASSARALGISNLTLRQESLNEVQYREEFDYVICTGVIHHNADPKSPLTSLTRALKPNGVMELMVYNRFHRIMTTAFQNAIRLFGNGSAHPDFEMEMKITRKVIHGFTAQNEMARFLDDLKDRPESELADSLLQPVEYSYTVESLESLARSCGLELWAPCINIFDKATNTFLWNLEFGDAQVQKFYDSFPDTKRWQIANSLLLEKSPILWFYLRRNDSTLPRKSETELCQEFLAQTFRASDTRKKFTCKMTLASMNSRPT